MSDSLKQYFEALERLKRRRARINNDAVALEAGRKKGSIKKSRPQFAELIEAIDEASKQVNASENEVASRLARASESIKTLREERDAALARELALVRQVFDLKRELVALRGGQVLPIRATKSRRDSKG